MLAHKHHVSGLGIGKYLISDIVGVGILKAARKRQKRSCFGKPRTSAVRPPPQKDEADHTNDDEDVVA